jgi:dihydrofolate reductase
MNIIVAVDKNWAIGYQNKLLNSIPEDMKFFRETTTGKVVVMGRKTLESFPNGRPLKNRTNVVITSQTDYEVPGAVVVHSVEEALDYVKDFKTEDVYVIGGASIYEQMLPYCDVAHVTVMDYAYQADSWFPNLDAMAEFVVAADSEEKTYFDLEYCFKMYVRKEKIKEILDFMD